MVSGGTRLRVYNYPARKTGKARRKRPAGRTIYSIEKLLDKQPQALRKDKRWNLMISYLSSEPRLLSLRFNKRCYSLLHNAVIKPDHLENFYRTYKLPKNPFFPLFLSIKREYLNERDRKKKEREDYIIQGLKKLPTFIKVTFTLMSRLEKNLTASSRCPVYRKSFLPGSKKKIDQYLKFRHRDWIDFFDNYLDLLAETYEHLPLSRVEYLDAALALQWTPDENYRSPDREKINRLYRELSKEYHPDKGGESRYFIKVNWAREYFIESGEKS